MVAMYVTIAVAMAVKAWLNILSRTLFSPCRNLEKSQRLLAASCEVNLYFNISARSAFDTIECDLWFLIVIVSWVMFVSRSISDDTTVQWES